MAAPRRIKAGVIVNDIRSGMSDSQLIEKYQLSATGLQRLFSKLVEVQAIEESELSGRLPLYKDSADVISSRQSLRRHPRFDVQVYEKENPQDGGLVRDITEAGLNVVNLPSAVGEVKRLEITAENFADVNLFDFKAECRWVKPDHDGEANHAGYEITEISSECLEELRNLILYLDLTLSEPDAS
jgi:PilZ domain